MSPLSTHGLSIGYGTPLFSGLNLQLEAGRLTSLLGLNGAGKSTLLRTLSGLQAPLSGSVRIFGKDIACYTRAQRAMLLGLVLTDRNSAGGLTVYELVSLGRHPHTDFLGRMKEADHAAVSRALEALGMARHADRFLSDLSDGERQKAFIAKALAQECPIIVLDEPTAFLDITSRIETMDMLHRLAEEQQKTVLLSTHDLDTAIRFSHCLWIADAQSGSIVSGACPSIASEGCFERIFGSKVAEMVAYSAKGK